MTVAVMSSLLKDTSYLDLETLQRVSDQKFAERNLELWQRALSIVQKLVAAKESLSALEFEENLDYSKFLDQKDDIDSLCREASVAETMVAELFVNLNGDIVVKGVCKSLVADVVGLYNKLFAAVVDTISADRLLLSNKESLNDLIMEKVMSECEKVWVSWERGWTGCELKFQTYSSLALNIEDKFLALKSQVLVSE